MRGWGVPLARRGAGVDRGRPVAGGSWPGGQPSPASSQPVARTVSVDRSEVTMSNRTRALVLAATLAAMNLAGLTAVAHAQATNEGKDARWPPSEGQVGETWRHSQAASAEQTAADAALQRQLARERFSIPNATPAQTTAQRPPNPAGHPAGSSLRSLSWPLRLRSPVGWPCWPPDGPAAGPGSGTRPDQESRSRRPMGLPRPPAAPSTTQALCLTGQLYP